MSELGRILGELWNERARVGLVGVGVLWGTLGLSLLLALGRSMGRATGATVEVFGSELVRLGPGSTTRPWQGLAAGRAIRFTPEDVELLRGLPGVRGVAHEHSSGAGLPVRVGARTHNAPLAGVSEDFGALRNHAARPGGRYLHVRDHREHRRVCFLGERLATTLFGSEEPVGREIELMGTPLLVVGVGPERITHTNYNGPDREKLVLPSTTLRDLTGWRFPSYAWLGLEAGAEVEAVVAQARRRLSPRLGFDPRDEEVFDATDYPAIQAMIEGILSGTSVFTGLVGVLGLLVAVVGVANAMLALVAERTRELGVQLALGAAPRILAAERLAEGVLVTALGGLLGLGAAALLLGALGRLPADPEVVAYLGRPQLDAPTALTVLFALIAAGALAGWMPARHALRLDPAEILREE